jgi:hypothetical protein
MTVYNAQMMVMMVLMLMMVYNTQMMVIMVMVYNTQMMVMVVYNTQNHWISGLCLVNEILSNYKAQHFGNWTLFLLQVRGWRHLLCWVSSKTLTSTSSTKVTSV